MSNKCNFDFHRFLEIEYEHGKCYSYTDNRKLRNTKILPFLFPGCVKMLWVIKIFFGAGSA